jgi:hypothetical protein
MTFQIAVDAPLLHLFTVFHCLLALLSGYALTSLASLALHWRRWHCIGVAGVAGIAGIAGNVICIFLCGYLELVA